MDEETINELREKLRELELDISLWESALESADTKEQYDSIFAELQAMRQDKKIIHKELGWAPIE